MRFLRRSITGLFLVALTFALLIWATQSIRSSIEDRMSRDARVPEGRERVFVVRAVTIMPREITPLISTFGKVTSRRTLDLRAPAAGAIVELTPNFVEGGSVAEGSLLLRIDPSEARAALAVARADLAQAEADLLEAERAIALSQDDLASAQDQAALRKQALARQRDIAARGVGSDAAVETAALAEAVAKQALLSRQQALADALARIETNSIKLDRTRIAADEAERALQETELRAEFSGVLTEVDAVQGGLLAKNEVLARLIDPQSLEVSFRLSTAQYLRLLDDRGRLSVHPVQVSLDVLGADLVTTGSIVREGGAVAPGTTGRELFASLKTSKAFRPGDFVSVTVAEPPLQQVSFLPASAVDSAGTILVIGTDDRLAVAEVEILRRQGDEVIVRAESLTGRQVVAERSPLLGAGIKVRSSPSMPVSELVAREELLDLDPERRARLVAFVESNALMPAEVRARMLAQLAEDRVPADMVARIEARMGG